MIEMKVLLLLLVVVDKFGDLLVKKTSGYLLYVSHVLVEKLDNQSVFFDTGG